MTETIQTDVLIIGGGLAGFRAAMRAKNFVQRVTLVDKASVARGGATIFCHVMAAPTPDGAHDDWLRDIVAHAEYLSNQEWAEVVLEEQGHRVRDLERWGLSFDRDEKGGYVLMAPRGADKFRAIYYEGRRLGEIMRRVLLANGINVVERVMITDLLTSDGEHPSRAGVVGAVGLNTRTAEPLVVKARAVVITSGFTAGKLKQHMGNMTGDGQAMAFRAGAELAGMEFSHWPSLCLCIGERGKGPVKYLRSGAQLQNHGAWIVNAAGERIMERYAPQLMERRSGFGLLGQAMAKEYLEGRGPLYFDMRHFPKEEVERLRRVLPQTMVAFDHAGIDIRRNLVEVIPMVVHLGCGNGGIKIGLGGETSLQGLFGAGVAVQMRPCIEPMASFAQAFCNVLGYRAGESAGRYAAGCADPAPKEEQLQQLLKTVLSPLGRAHGTGPDDIFLLANKVLVPLEYGVIKNEARILKALTELQRIETEVLSRVRAEEPHALIKANEARNYLLLLKLSYISALERKETRLCHYRQEFPFRDDENWLNWTILRKEGDEIRLGFEPIPIERYRIRPTTLTKVPAAVQGVRI